METRTINKLIILTILTINTLYLKAAEPVDTITYSIATNVHLDDVEVIGYLQPQQRLLTPTSVGILNAEELRIQSVNSMVPAINSLPGVRMEERSPGSYRLSIRGSLVRSPYGVRNVKIYYNDFALTDAGGNTYLNMINVNDLDGLEVLKGPDGSLFGANSGGVVFLKSDTDTLPRLHINIYGGTRGLIGNNVHLARNIGKHYWTIRQSFQRSDGYRRNTKNHRLFFQLSDRWQYHRDYHLEAYIFYSDLNYQTPGGLTREQYEQDPRQARPATPAMPGSIEQKTRINTRMYFGGLSHKANFSPLLRHTLSVWGNYVDFIYPFITNYEIRNEGNLGLRTFFTLANHQSPNRVWKPSLDAGFEWQRLVTDAYNYDNNGGQKGKIQAYNDIVNLQYFGFLRGRLEWNNRLVVEAAVSLNHNGYHFRDTTQIKNNFPLVWMPHFAVNYRILDPIALRFTVSKGYSNPTTAEIRPSDNKIYTNLHAEQGWNTELGIRGRLFNGRLTWDLSGYHYLLEDGIVSQTDSTANTFFVNSGKIKQLGVECSLSTELLPYNEQRSFFKQIRWNSNYTYSHYKYEDYIINGNNHSGNRVAGVPRTTLINSLYFQIPAGLSLFLQHNYTSRIPLNDSNNAFSDPYNLFSAKLEYTTHTPIFLPNRIYIFADNLLNEKYSLGNDINAFGGRYYNAAPTFNFQIGASWDF